LVTPFDDSASHAAFVTSGFQSKLPGDRSDDDLFSTATDRDEIDTMFAWKPSLEDWFEPEVAATRVAARSAYVEHGPTEDEAALGAAREFASVQPPLRLCENGSDFVFVSYRHADFASVVPLLRSLDAARYPFWFDRSIPGGSQWTAVLQDRLRQSNA